MASAKTKGAIMGVSTDGIIFCGWPLEEDAELPWDNEDNEDDGVEDCWRRVSGYKPLFELWTPAGEYVGGVRPPEDRMSAYGDHQREWDKANPIPFEVENYCSAECPMYAITVPGAGATARRGYPTKIDASFMGSVDSVKVEGIRALLAEHGVELDGEPSWYLGSYWG